MKWLLRVYIDCQITDGFTDHVAYHMADFSGSILKHPPYWFLRDIVFFDRNPLTYCHAARFSRRFGIQLPVFELATWMISHKKIWTYDTVNKYIATFNHSESKSLRPMKIINPNYGFQGGDQVLSNSYASVLKWGVGHFSTMPNCVAYPPAQRWKPFVIQWYWLIDRDSELIDDNLRVG